MVLQTSATLKNSLYRDGKFSRQNKNRNSVIKRSNSIESIRSIQHEQTKLKAIFQTFFQRRKKLKDTLPLKEQTERDSDRDKVIIKKQIERSSSEGEKLNMLIERQLIDKKLEKYNVREIKAESKFGGIIKTRHARSSNSDTLNSDTAYDSEASTISNHSITKEKEKEKLIRDYCNLQDELSSIENELKKVESEINELEKQIEETSSQSEYSEILRDEYYVNAEIESTTMLMKSVIKLTTEQKVQMTENLKLIEKLEVHIKRRNEYIEKMKESFERRDEMPRVMRRQISNQKNFII